MTPAGGSEVKHALAISAGLATSRAAAHPVRLAMCAPVAVRFGTEAQKKRFLPRILPGRDFWCQGYSSPARERPGLAENKASERTITTSSTARRPGPRSPTTPTGSLTGAHRSDEREAPGRHLVLLIDMKTAGVSVTPLILMDGAHEVNEVFFASSLPAETPGAHVRRAEVAKYLLGEAHEHGRIANPIQLARLRGFFRKMHDVRFRDRLSRWKWRSRRSRSHNLRFLDRMRRTGQPAQRRRLDAEGSRAPRSSRRWPS